MNTYGIKVPFPEVMTQKMYDSLHYQKEFWEYFNMENYTRQCDIVDEKINNLLCGSKEEFIEYKDIPQHLEINYLKDKITLLEDFLPIKFECLEDNLRHGFIIKLNERKK